MCLYFGIPLTKSGALVPFAIVGLLKALAANTAPPSILNPYAPPRVWNQDQSMTDNDPFIYKKGGRVGVGKAKRGFGRALKKGK